MADTAALLLQLGRTLIIVFGVLLLCGLIVGIAWFVMRTKVYKKYKVLIFKRKKNKDGTITPVFVGTDKAAIRYDRRLKTRYLHVAKINTRMANDVPSMPSEKGGELVIIEKIGPKTYGFGTPDILKGEMVINVSEADASEAIRAYDINAKHFGKDAWKWAGPVAFGVFAVLIIVLIAVVLQKFEILVDVSDKLVRVAEVLQAGRSSAVPSGVPT